jgi:hypothetical protein
MDQSSRYVVLVILLLSVLSFLLGTLALFAYYPIFGTALIVLISSGWWYVMTEHSVLHDAQEFENRFWTLVGFVFSSCVVFIHDSPFAIGQWSPSAGFLLVSLFTFGIHSYDRHLHRNWIARVPNMPSGMSSSLMVGTTVQEKAKIISRALGNIDSTLVATNIQHFIMSEKRLALEDLIVTTLQDATSDELNYLLPRIRLGLLFYKVKNHSIAPHRTRLLDLLCVSRVAELSVTSRAVLLDAMQQMKLTAHPNSDFYAKNIITKTKDDDLSRLKCLCDNKGDFHSLHKLVYSDIKDPGVRADILKHIKKQAQVQAAHTALGTRTGRVRQRRAWRKILSDVDDTLLSSGGRYPAGVDTTYPRKAVYPGVLDLYRELDIGKSQELDSFDSNCSIATEEDRKGGVNFVGNLVFLSARPHVYKDISEAHTYSKFRRLQEEHGLYTTPSLLPGSVETGASFLLMNDMEPLARKKFDNYEQYASLYPEFRMVFIGDNGQGDVRAAELMQASPYGKQLEAVFIHQVQPMESTYGYEGPDTLRRWRESGIFFFTDYVAAAVHAYSCGLIGSPGLRRVAAAAVTGFEGIHLDRPLVRESKRRSINTSIERANRILAQVEQGPSEPVPYIKSVPMFHIGAKVLTPFGKGTVHAFRPEGGVYEVFLEWSSQPSSVAGVKGSAPQSAALASAAACASGTASKSTPLSPMRVLLPSPAKIKAVERPFEPISAQKPFIEKPPEEAPYSHEVAPETWVEPITSAAHSLMQFQSPNFNSCGTCGTLDSPPRLVLEPMDLGLEELSLGIPALENSSRTLQSFSAAEPEPEMDDGVASDTELYALRDMRSRPLAGFTRTSSCTRLCSTPEPLVPPEPLLSAPRLLPDPAHDHSASLDSGCPPQHHHSRQRSHTMDSNINDIVVGDEMCESHEVECFGRNEGQCIFQPKAYLQLEALQHAPREPKRNERRQLLKARTSLLFRSRSDMTETNQILDKHKILQKGSIATCNLGQVVVVQYRPKDGIYEVNFSKWVLSDGKPARAYLRREDLKPVSWAGQKRESSLSATILGLFTKEERSRAGAAGSQQPWSKGDKCVTIFGRGVVEEVRRATAPSPVAKPAMSPIGSLALTRSKAATTSTGNGVSALVIRLVDWPLACPKGYATGIFNPASVAREGASLYLRSTPRISRSQSSAGLPRYMSIMGAAGGVFTSLGGLVTSSSPRLPVSHPQLIPTGSVVRTSFGSGYLRHYRSTDGIYVVALLDWRLQGGKCAVAFLPGSSLGRVIFRPHSAVLTPLGLAVVKCVREDGIAEVVALWGGTSSLGTHMFLRVRDIRGEMPASLGENVTTPMGMGKVLGYSVTRRMYIIALEWCTIYMHESQARVQLTRGLPKHASASIMTSVLNALKAWVH